MTVSTRQLAEACRTIFAYYEIEDTLDNVAQFQTLLEALRLYHGRTAAYGQVWKQYGAMSNLLSMARKCDRLMSIWWTEEEEVLGEDGKPKPKLHKDNLDDALDLLNYTVFFIRNARAGVIFGSIPPRPGITDLAELRRVKS